MTLRIEIPEKLLAVFQGDADARGAYGGRGSAKTRTFALMTAVKGMVFASMGIRGQLLCARKHMNSLDDSSLEEIKRAIESEPALTAFYEVGEKYIRAKDGSVWYTFAGLDKNLGSIKSKGRILLCWVDEAEDVGAYAWTTLIPTLREEGDDWNAELWVTWNPRRKGSPTDLRFRKSKDPRYKFVELNWRDNPKFPAILNRQRLRDEEENPDEYDHIWEGAYGSQKGAILAKWVHKALREGRVNDDVKYDPEGAPIVISSDLGFRDTASWWYWQPCPGGFNLLKYDADTGMDADDWIPRVKETLEGMGPKLGKLWLPHDARAKTFQSKHTTISKFIAAFGADKCAIVPQSRKSDQISAARHVIAKCAFNQTDCELGLDGLIGWEFEYNEETGIFSREPRHDWASHPSDAFAYGCQVIAESVQKEPEKPPVFPITSKSNRIVTAPLEELWSETPRRSERF